MLVTSDFASPATTAGSGRAARARYHLQFKNEVTDLLNALGPGDPHAASGLLPLVPPTVDR
jgi:hypothetical protein